MIQATAEQKAKIASQTKTRRAGELLELELNDMVDFYRKPITKDGHGWIGPAEVVNLTSMKDGMIHVKWQGHIIAVRIGDVRRSLMFPVFLTKPTGPVRVFKEEVENHIGVITRVGWIREITGHRVKPTVNSQKSFPQDFMSHQCVSQLDGVIGFGFGANVQSLTAVNFDDTLLLWWQVGRIDEWSHSYINMTGTKFVNRSKMIGECENVAVAHFFMVDPNDVSQIRSIAPEVPHLGGVCDPSMPKLRDMTDDIAQRSKHKPIEEQQSTEQDDDPTSPKIATPGPLIEEVPTSNSSSTVEDHFVETNYVFDSVSVTADIRFPGATYLSSPPPVNICGIGVSETLERSVIDADVPEIEFEPGFTKYLVLPNSAAFSGNSIKESRIVFAYEQGKTPFAVIEREHNILTRDEALENT